MTALHDFERDSHLAAYRKGLHPNLPQTWSKAESTSSPPAMAAHLGPRTVGLVGEGPDLASARIPPVSWRARSLALKQGRETTGLGPPCICAPVHRMGSHCLSESYEHLTHVEPKQLVTPGHNSFGQVQCRDTIERGPRRASEKKRSRVPTLNGFKDNWAPDHLIQATSQGGHPFSLDNLLPL